MSRYSLLQLVAYGSQDVYITGSWADDQLTKPCFATKSELFRIRLKTFVEEGSPHTKRRTALKLIKKSTHCERRCGSGTTCRSTQSALRRRCKAYFMDVKKLEHYLRTAARSRNVITVRLPRELSDMIFAEIGKVALDTLRTEMAAQKNS